MTAGACCRGRLPPRGRRWPRTLLVFGAAWLSLRRGVGAGPNGVSIAFRCWSCSSSWTCSCLGLCCTLACGGECPARLASSWAPFLQATHWWGQLWRGDSVLAKASRVWGLGHIHLLSCHCGEAARASGIAWFISACLLGPNNNFRAGRESSG